MASKIKRLLGEIHHRSLWQSVLAYGAGCIAILSGVDLLEGILGLPDWVLRATAIICVAALPLIVATTYIQKKGIGGPELVSGAPEKGLRRWFNWRNLTIVLGAAFALLASGAGGYMGLRVAGVGPWGTLQARGLLPDSVKVLVADLDSAPEDSATAFAVSEVLRVGLSESEAIRLVDVEEVQATLLAMRLPPGSRLTDSVAREVATREGIPALLLGSLTRMEGGYQISTRLIDTEGRSVLLRLEERAPTDAGILGTEGGRGNEGAADRIVGKIRERIGESLRSVQNRKPLPTYTTSSLEALQAYERALREPDQQSRYFHLREAVRLDSTFAMAWRVLAAVGGVQSVLQRDSAVVRAFQLSERLPRFERLHIRTRYFLQAEDYATAVQEYERFVEEYPEEVGAWNNLGRAHFFLGNYEEYLRFSKKSVDLEPAPNGNLVNLIEAALALGDLETARWAVDTRRELVPDGQNRGYELFVGYAEGDLAELRRALLEGMRAAEGEGLGNRSGWYRTELSRLDALEGRLGSMEERVTFGPTWLGYLNLFALDRRDRAMALFDEWVRSLDLANTRPLDLPMGWLVPVLCLLERPQEARAVLDEWKTAASAPEVLRPPVVIRDSIIGLNGEWSIAMAEGRVEEGLDYGRRTVRAVRGDAFTEAFLAWDYDRAGMPDSALVAYHRYVAAPVVTDWRFGARTNWDPFLLAHAYERLGQLHEERGELEEAAKYHRLFVDLWANAEPELQPRVKAAREALERLQAERAGPPSFESHSPVGTPTGPSPEWGADLGLRRRTQ